MNGNLDRGADRRPAEAIRSMAWPDYNANLSVALKTRRAVRDAVISNGLLQGLPRRHFQPASSDGQERKSG